MKNMNVKSTREELKKSLLKYLTVEEVECIDTKLDFGWNTYYVYNKIYTVKNKRQYNSVLKLIEEHGLFCSKEFGDTRLGHKLKMYEDKIIEQVLEDKRKELGV